MDELIQRLSKKIKPDLLDQALLLKQADDYFAIADQDNLDGNQRDRLRRAATAMFVAATE